MVLAFWIICKAVQYYLYKLTYTTHRGQSPSDLCLPSWVFMLLEKGICSPGMCMLIQTGLLLTASDPRCRLDLWVQPSAPPRPTRSPDPCGITHTGHKLSFSHRSKLSHLSLSVCLSRHSEPHQAGQSQGLDSGGGNRVTTHENGSKPSLSDALRTVPCGLFTDSHQIRDVISPSSPGRLVGKYFKPDFFWKESLRNFCPGTSWMVLV